MELIVRDIKSNFFSKLKVYSLLSLFISVLKVIIRPLDWVAVVYFLPTVNLVKNHYQKWWRNQLTHYFISVPIIFWESSYFMKNTMSLKTLWNERSRHRNRQAISYWIAKILGDVLGRVFSNPAVTNLWQSKSIQWQDICWTLVYFAPCAVPAGALLLQFVMFSFLTLLQLPQVSQA